jgi:hypothetical protein
MGIGRDMALQIVKKFEVLRKFLGKIEILASIFHFI